MFKKLTSLLLVFTMILPTFSNVAFAQNSSVNALKESVVLMVDENNCYINGNIQSVGDLNPLIVDGRTLVPARFLSECLGGKADWNGETKTAYLDCNGNHIEVPIGENYIVVNGKEKEIDVGGTIVNGRTVLPLRGICEAIGKNVSYDEGMIIIGDEDLSNVSEDDLDFEIAKDAIRQNLTPVGSLNISSPDRNLNDIVSGCKALDFRGYQFPFETTDSQYFNISGLYIDNVKIDKASSGDYTLEFDAYNKEYTCAVAESYYANGTLADIAVIDAFTGPGSNIVDYFKDLYSGYETLTGKKPDYQWSFESKASQGLSLYIPKNGSVLFTLNPNDSYYVGAYNIIHGILSVADVALTGYRLVSVIKNGPDTVTQALKNRLNEVFIVDTKSGINAVTEAMQLLTSQEFDPWHPVESAKQLVTNIEKVMQLIDFNLGEEVQKALGENVGEGVNDIISSMLGVNVVSNILTAWEGMFDVSALLCYGMDLKYVQKTKSVIWNFN